MPEMKPEASDSYVRYWKQRQADTRRRNQKLAQEARRELDGIIQTLTDRYGAVRVILFGSLVKGRFSQESDIDLAVAGLAAGDFFAAIAEVNRLSRFQVDLKPLEGLHPHFRRRVLAQGEVVYEAPGPAGT